MSGIEVRLDDLPESAPNPGRIRDDEDEAELVVGEEDGPEEVPDLQDPLPGDVEQGPVVPDVGEGSLDVLLLDQHDPAFVLGRYGVS